MSRVCLAGKPTSYMAKALTLNITRKLFNQIFFIRAILLGTTDFCHFVLLSLTLTLPGGHKVSAK